MDFMNETAILDDLEQATPEMMASNDFALEFLGKVADENKGRTRVTAAIRAIDFVRNFLGIRALKEDARTAMLKNGVLRMNLAARISAGVPLPVRHPFLEAKTCKKVYVLYLGESIGGR